MANDLRNKPIMQYLQRLAAVMFFYLLTVWRVTGFVRSHHQLSNFKLYFLSALPTIPVIAMLFVVGLYLHDERDEFKRQQTVIAMLWATAITLGFTAFTDFLRSYGAIVAVPPFTEFCIFWISLGVVSVAQGFSNHRSLREQ